MIKNRQINTDFNSDSEGMVLVFKKKGIFEGKEFRQGDTIIVSKSKAKRLLSSAKDTYSILVD